MPKHILIIDNGSMYLRKLQHICGDALAATIKPGAIDLERADKHDLIILSGGFQHEVMGSEQFYAKELQLIRQAIVPIVGVCLGFQLVAHAFNIPIHEMEQNEFGIHDITMTKLGAKLLGEGPYKVFEDHTWVVEKTPDNFHELALSHCGLEAIMHDALPVAGFQFHPEKFVTKSDGIELFARIISIFETRQALIDHNDYLDTAI